MALRKVSLKQPILWTKKKSKKVDYMTKVDELLPQRYNIKVSE